MQYRALGNVVWIEDRVLTAAHLFEQWPPPPGILLNGKVVRVLGAWRGGRLSGNKFGESRKDWAALHVGMWAPKSWARIAPGDGRVRQGDIVYVVARDDRGAAYVASPMKVVMFTGVAPDGERHPLPPGLIAAMPYKKRDFRGWSGGLVARHDSAQRQWEFVGLFVAALETTKGRLAHIIVRPPERVVMWLFEGPDVEPMPPEARSHRAADLP